MRRLALGAVAAATALGSALVPAGPTVAVERPPAAPDWSAKADRVVRETWHGPRMVDLTFESAQVASVLSRPKVRVLLPRGYAETRRRYPMLLLLHGAGDRFDGWTSNRDGWPTTVRRLTRDKDVVVVMPDGGTADEPGWYSDWYNQGAYGSPRWETFHLTTVLPTVQERFRVEDDRDARVVAGLSMGGFGAFSYAARHPDLFAGAFALSGALDTRLVMDSVFPGPWGTEADSVIRVRGHNPVDLVDNLRHTRLWLRTGQGFPGGPAPRDNELPGLGVEQVVGKLNESFAAAATDAGVDHTYESYLNGGHNWWHWQSGLERAWPEIEKVFAIDRPDRPRRFDYRSTEPSFRVWGWRVATHRDVTEFLRLEDVRRAGFRAIGSGSLTVRTPALYEPGRDYVVEVAGGESAASSLVRADRRGRLRLDVELGPSHTADEDTPEQQAAAAADPAYWQQVEVRIRPAGR